MFSHPLFILLSIACIAVVLILVFGLGTFLKGGDFNRKYGNKLMQMRIGAQFVAIILILLFVALAGKG